MMVLVDDRQSSPTPGHPLGSLPFFDQGHRDLWPRIAAFVAEHIAPRAAAADAGNPNDAARGFAEALADRGWFEYLLPGRAGSASKPDLTSVCLVRECLAGGSALADGLYAAHGLGAFPLLVAASPALRDRWLPRVASGRAIAGFALTEPDAGSDVGAIRTTARPDGDDYVIDGEKTLISNAGIADYLVVFARTSDDNAAARRALSAFVVETNRPGCRVAREVPLLAPHAIADLRFENCRVPSASRLGSEGDGLGIALATLDFYRTSVGAAACGLAARALQEARERVLSRTQFGIRLADHQATRFALADMATQLDAARLLVYRAAWRSGAGAARLTREASMSKLFATEAAQRIVDAAVQLHGGSGVSKGTVVERLYREVRALRIYEGTSEIQRLVIGRHIVEHGIAIP